MWPRKVCEQAAACADHFQKALAGMMVLAVNLKVFGQLVDALGQKRHLHFRRTGVSVVNFDFLYNSLLFVLCKHYLINIA